MRQYYQPWDDNALIIDSLRGSEENFTLVLDTIYNARHHVYVPHQPLDPHQPQRE
jgi:hypothetical protein